MGLERDTEACQAQVDCFTTHLCGTSGIHTETKLLIRTSQTSAFLFFKLLLFICLTQKK